MSFKPYTENIKKKKIGICSILGRIRIRIRIQTRTRIQIHHPGSGSGSASKWYGSETLVGTKKENCFIEMTKYFNNTRGILHYFIQNLNY